MKILVAGGLTPDFEPGNSEEICARAIGRAITSNGHTLLSGSYNDFDRFVAEAAFEAAGECQAFGDPKMAIHSYLSPGADPAHRIGHVRNLNVKSWDPGQPDWGIPEPLRECDALVVVGGGPATHRVVHLTRFAGKPIVPITVFQGAASEAFRFEWDRFDEIYAGRVHRDEYSVVDSAVPGDFDALAHEVLSLVAKIVTGNEVFVIMSFGKESDDTYSTISRVCRTYRFESERTDNDPSAQRIYNRIVDGIHRAAFVIADVTIDSLNVYYELGFAEALEKHIVVVAKQGTDLPFDTSDISTIFYVDQTRLEEALSKRIESLSGRRAASI